MSEFNSEPIDIIVPWVNPNDPAWQKDFEYWKEKETGQKDACRFRDMGVFNYWFRCIEKNMPWVRYVFLVLASPSQIPSWLNVNHPKLKIVYHDQFIPKEELPTFNSSVINCYVPFIEELSDNYILFNDDFFVISKINEYDYFKNNIPIGKFNASRGKPGGKEPWYHNICNNSTIVESLFNVNQHIMPEHGPIAFKKSLQIFVHNKLKKQIKYALSNSKFRQNKNITDWIFYDIQALTNNMIKRNNNILSFQYVNSLNFKSISKLVCFNDNETLNEKTYNDFKNKVKKYLESKFNKKSSFEK